VPLSLAGQAWFDGRVDRQAALEKLATGGDDYEIAFTVAAPTRPRCGARPSVGICG
jgi:thiamine-monophosphate kinase